MHHRYDRPVGEAASQPGGPHAADSRNRYPLRWLLSRCVLGLATASAIAGCGQGSSKTLKQMVAECGEVPGARATTNPTLKLEVDRLQRAGMLPAQLASVMPPDDENVAAILASVFDVKLLTGMVEKGRQLFPRDRFRFDPIQLRKVARYRRNYQPKLDLIYSALRRPKCNFAIDFKQGFFFEPTFVREIDASFHLLACEAAEHLDAGSLVTAQRPLLAMLRLADLLAHEPLVTARAMAAELRGKALLVVESIAEHPECRPDHLLTLYTQLANQLATWPSDVPALEGERAMVMHSYEAIRSGLLPWLLTAEEKELFEEEGLQNEIAEALRDSADEDEAAYLSIMRRYIELADLPFFQRRAELEQIKAELHGQRNAADYPIAAARLFLPGLEDFMRETALDRARCEAWALALAAGGGGESPDFDVNPGSGVPYRIERFGDRLVVRLGTEGERDPMVPSFETTAARGVSRR